MAGARALSVLLPAILAAAHVAHVPDAAHDLGVVRAMGFGWTGALRALDALAGAALAWLPIGTRAFRAGLGSSLLCGAAAGLVFELGWALVGAVAPRATRLGPAAAAVAALTCGLSVAWQLEAATAGGSVLGAALVLAPLVLLTKAKNVQDAPIATLGLLLGLAATYEPLVALASLASTAAFVALSARAEGVSARDLARKQGRFTLTLFAAAAAVGLAAPAFAFARGRLDPRLVLSRPGLASALGEAGASPRGSPVALVHAELGWALVALAVAGLVLAARGPGSQGRGRPLAAGLFVVALVGLGSVAVGAAAGPTRWAGPVLAAMGALLALAALAMQAVVRGVTDARIPFAQASAAMIVVLLLAFPARVADEAWTRAEERARGGAAAWDEAAWGTVPFGSVVLLDDRRALERVVATRATGAMRSDLAIVPFRDLAGPMASREIAREPKLQAFLRDMALEGAPEELSLSSLAAARPVAMTFDPRWDKPLSRHLVPAGMLARFETEPRGSSDRKRELDKAAPALARFERKVTRPRDLELCAVAASLLRARTIAFAAAGDREIVARGLDELRPFAPDDAVASELSRRVVSSKGGIEVKDLAP